MFEAEILRLSRKVKESADDPALRDHAIAELKAAIRTEQEAIKAAIRPTIDRCRELLPP